MRTESGALVLWQLNRARSKEGFRHSASQSCVRRIESFEESVLDVEMLQVSGEVTANESTRYLVARGTNEFQAQTQDGQAR